MRKVDGTNHDTRKNSFYGNIIQVGDMITDNNLKINKQNSELSNHNKMTTVLFPLWFTWLLSSIWLVLRPYDITNKTLAFKIPPPSPLKYMYLLLGEGYGHSLELYIVTKLLRLRRGQRVFIYKRNSRQPVLVILSEKSGRKLKTQLDVVNCFCV